MSDDQAVDPKTRILLATARLLATKGRDAVSTRSVSAAASVQAPTIYRHFGDMQGLLDAAAARAVEDYQKVKDSLLTYDDPVENLRHGWDLHVEFGVTNPAVYALLYGDGLTSKPLPTNGEGEVILHILIRRVAELGRLRVTVERAAQLMHSAAVGTTLTLIASPADAREGTLSHTMREAILSAIIEPSDQEILTTDGPSARLAVSLKASLSPADGLTPPEQALLAEWLDRIAVNRERHQAGRGHSSDAQPDREPSVRAGTRRRIEAAGKRPERKSRSRDKP